MKRILLLLALVGVLMAACASAEGTDIVVSPETDAAQAQAEQTPMPDVSLDSIDFSNLTPEDPSATPIPVDPIDKPTPTPLPKPNYWYETYENADMGIAFSIPGTWLLNPNTNQDTTIQFVEPKSEMMEVGGYQTRLTVEKVNTGLSQTAADAKERLETTLMQLEGTFTSFTPGNLASTTIGDAKGYYCYYKAEYNDGTKTYQMRGRIAIVAHEKALYQVRITTPQTWYSYYENVFRSVRNSFEFN